MPDPTRRDWIRIVGAGSAALAIGCGDNVGGATPDFAAAVLEPTTEALSVAIWARLGGEAIVEVSTDDEVRRTTITIGDSGTAILELAALAAGTEHEIKITIGDVELGPYRAQTAPAEDDTRKIRIAIAADADTNPAFDTDLIDHVIEAEPDLLVTLGDYPYTDNGPPAMTYQAYRARHAEMRALPKIRALHQAMAVRSIYDDHEFVNDWDANRSAAEPARYTAALAVWDEFFPVRGATGEIRYRSWRWGAHAECFMLDCRRFRSANDTSDPARKTMLGAQQLAWFLDAIARSTAPFKLIFSSVPLDFGRGADHWGGFPRERQIVFDALLGIPGIVFLSADQHWLAAHRHTYGIREFQIGPLARSIGSPGAAPPGVLFRATEYNVGIVEVDATELKFFGLGPGGVRLYEETLTAEELTPRR